MFYNPEEKSTETKRLKLEHPKTYGLNRRYDKSKTKKYRIQNRCADEPTTALIFDNGAHTIKTGLSTFDEPMIVPNCIMKVKSEKKRLFIGNQIDECRDLSGLFYLLPCERGYITRWEVQKPIWDYVFSKNVSPINDNPVVITQPILNFKSIQECIDEIFFEEYEVKAMYRANPTDFAYYDYINNITGEDVPCIIIDSGYSFTHVVPYIDGKKYFKAIKRIDIGGKFLTNVLRDVISYRMYDVMEETHVINQVKEDTCFVSEDINKALDITKLSGNDNTIVRNYVLPDFNTIRRGHIQDPNVNDELADTRQSLRLNNERFTVPEILFRPSDIGKTCAGISESLIKCIQNCPPSKQNILCKNIILIGGNVNMPGFKNRLHKDIRTLLPESCKINIYVPTNPTLYAWQGARSFSQDSSFKSFLVTKEEYFEHGSIITQSKFNNWSSYQDEIVKKKIEIQSESCLNNLEKYDVFGKCDSSSSENEEIIDEVSPESSREKISYTETNTSCRLGQLKRHGTFGPAQSL